MIPKSYQCKKCPGDTYLNQTGNRLGVSSCLKCGKNLKSSDGVSCKTDCRFNDSSGKSYDLSNLKG